MAGANCPCCSGYCPCCSGHHFSGELTLTFFNGPTGLNGSTTTSNTASGLTMNSGGTNCSGVSIDFVPASVCNQVAPFDAYQAGLHCWVSGTPDPITGLPKPAGWYLDFNGGGTQGLLCFPIQEFGPGAFQCDPFALTFTGITVLSGCECSPGGASTTSVAITA